MMENQKTTEEDVIEINLVQLLKALWEHAWIVVFVTLLGCSLAYLGTRTLVQPTYRASFTAYVNNKSGTEGTTTVSTSDLSAAQSLVYTYTHILTSRTMLEAAATQIGADYSYDDMTEWVTMIIAHELGHAVLHKKLCVEAGGIIEFEIFNMTNTAEYEANVFQAILLIDEDELLRYLKEGNDVVFTARAMNVNVNLLVLKLSLMAEENANYHFNLPYIPRRNFLGTVEDDAAGSI